MSSGIVNLSDDLCRGSSNEDSLSRFRESPRPIEVCDTVLLHETSFLIDPADIQSQDILLDLGVLFRSEGRCLAHVLDSLAGLPAMYLDFPPDLDTTLSSAFLALYARLICKHHSCWWSQDFGDRLEEASSRIDFTNEPSHFVPHG